MTAAEFNHLSSWPGLSRLRGRSRFGEAKARPSTSLLQVNRKTGMPGTRPGMTTSS
jgi:hypothetical protein